MPSLRCSLRAPYKDEMCIRDRHIDTSDGRRSIVIYLRAGHGGLWKPAVTATRSPYYIGISFRHAFTSQSLSAGAAPSGLLLFYYFDLWRRTSPLTVFDRSGSLERECKVRLYLFELFKIDHIVCLHPPAHPFHDHADICVCFKAVSYTHLDVYKRQAYA